MQGGGLREPDIDEVKEEYHHLTSSVPVCAEVPRPCSCLGLEMKVIRALERT